MKISDPKAVAGEVLAPVEQQPHEVEMNDLKPETQSFVLQIAENWRRVVSSIIETGQAITAARGSLKKDPSELDRFDSYLRTRLGISTSERSKLEQIGAKMVFRQEQNADRLPKAVATLYQLSQLGDDQLQAAIASETISPSITLAEVRKTFFAPKAKKSKPVLTISISGNPKNIPSEKVVELNALLDEFEEFIKVKRTGL